jgi:hypothetical protein
MSDESVIKIELRGHEAWCLIYPNGIEAGVDGGGEFYLPDPRILRIVIEREDQTTTTLNIRLDQDDTEEVEQ